jgi:hypothetical protein
LFRQDFLFCEDFAACKIKFVENYAAGKFTYIAPEVVYMQAFAGPTSTESRLVGSRLDVMDWDAKDYNDKYFYYNRVHRSYGWHDVKTNVELGVDHCGDCAIMTRTFDNYKEKWGYGDTTLDMISRLLHVCRRNLFDGSIHGHYMHKFKSTAELIRAQVLAHQAIVAKLVSPRPRDFVPMTIAAAYNYARIISRYTAVDKGHIMHMLVLAWAFGWRSRVAELVAAPKLVQYGVTQTEIDTLRGPPPTIDVVITDTEISAGEFKFPREADMAPEVQLISRLTSHVTDVAEVICAALDEYADYKIIARDSQIKINGRRPDYNIYLDNIFELPRDKYLVFVPNASALLRATIADHFAERFVFVDEYRPDKVSQQFSKSKEKIVDSKCRLWNGETITRQFIIKSA